MLHIFAYESQLYEELSEDEKSALLENVTCAAEEAEIKRLKAQREEMDEIVEGVDPSNSTSINSYNDNLLLDDEERTPVLPKKKKNGRPGASKGGDLLDESFSNPDSLLPKQFSLSQIQSLEALGSEGTLFKNIIHLLIICVGDLTAGTMTGIDVFGVNRQPNFQEFVAFL